ncbi:MAG: hypothetical protein AAB557_05240 [Patescibacteria group bacterium]
MDFERCAGCPGGECPAQQFADAIARGDISVDQLARGRAPGAFQAVYIQRATDGRAVDTCPGVPYGLGDRAEIVKFGDGPRIA